MLPDIRAWHCPLSCRDVQRHYRRKLRKTLCNCPQMQSVQQPGESQSRSFKSQVELLVVWHRSSTWLNFCWTARRCQPEFPPCSLLQTAFKPLNTWSCHSNRTSCVMFHVSPVHKTALLLPTHYEFYTAGMILVLVPS